MQNFSIKKNIMRFDKHRKNESKKTLLRDKTICLLFTTLWVAFLNLKFSFLFPRAPTTVVRRQ